MYPVMMNIKNKRVVMIGGGNVAARKLKKLLQEGAHVTIVSPTLHESIPKECITWIERRYETGDLNGAKLVFACTDDQEVNVQIMRDADTCQLVNNTGDKHFSDFYNVSIVEKKDFSINISTNGVSPMRAKEIRQKLEKLLDEI
ncbi:bifunctional precorrin-2 dehydrogenase/sirohydrochlorin ferrochelatase [Granulicatella sp. zg-ZJ]|uniref:precorrin-2 dehydrogenase/sirohydrochlorin ferrochelatase family protein n=1 Tax=unclassified Granulicatella TaxID=2630493 RepID=UPI0013C0FCC8|nr:MULTISPECIES: bifunctional precorrin-2 dehydrogenase/sirohydrochlorin ferrochelatase [unclassified Granulicatella]MBS4749701.1 bifunctional precorrin-2 dehydrogenase/sirohydrochlorin ferrochelatase [Carnobacteriaceae bacterium zg-ZUI78]NEW61830.1 bifunctional precorrin-2 dehydrogenase/sirohydrochlorin ferrochelatase [Granulicatella sp. zg-ZJ]NEW65904.1 bifunctional precorrin-2 dehydrogenase/sirohydrochlorin ferrochelatase [Granulicatella sp. zg-84]QMI85133.1 bifunctional precorrin-2 dehydrog